MSGFRCQAMSSILPSMVGASYCLATKVGRFFNRYASTSIGSLNIFSPLLSPAANFSVQFGNGKLGGYLKSVPAFPDLTDKCGHTPVDADVVTGVAVLRRMCV